MCGRFTLRTPTPVLTKLLRVSTAPELTPRFNIAPTQPVPVVRQSGDSREMLNMRWGLVPSWAKDLKIGARMINARSETAATKPSFRSAMKRRRCLVVADGYYEWKKAGTSKQPFYIRMADEAPFAMAGLWESWRGGNDQELPEPILSCTVLTTDANELTSDLHDRMPVILRNDDWDFWLDAGLLESEPLQPLMVPYDSEDMKIDAVSTYVNNARHEGPECVEGLRELF